MNHLKHLDWLIPVAISIFVLLAVVTALNTLINEFHKNDPPPYPGKRNMSLCADLWDKGYNKEINVEKCETTIDKPKYKVGTRLVPSNKFAMDTCKSFITGTYFWNVRKNEQEYFVQTICPLEGNLVYHSDDFVTESDIKVFRK